MLAALLALVALPVLTGSARAAIDANTGVGAAEFNGDLDVFYTGLDEGLWQMTYVPGSGWRAAAKVPGGGTLSSGPAVDVFRSGNELDVFGRGTNNQLYETEYRNGSGWGHWTSLGGGLASGPAVDVYRSGAEINVFARGTNNQLYQKSYTSSGWSGWSSLGGGLTSGPGADVFHSGTQVDVWVRGGDDGLWQRYFNGSAWSSGWKEVPGTGNELTSAPTSVVSSATQLDVIYAGTNYGLWDTRYVTGVGWEAPVPIAGTAGTVASAPSAVLYDGSIDVFYLSGDGGLRQVSSGNSGASWSGPVTPAPTVAAPPPVTVPVSTPTPAPAPAPMTSTSTIKPHKKHGRRPLVKASLQIHWKWNRHGTRVARVKTLAFPPKARITITCSGRRCPLAMSAGWRELGRLWHQLEHHWFHRHDKVTVKITQRGHSPVRAQFQIRRGRQPLQR